MFGEVFTDFKIILICLFLLKLFLVYFVYNYTNMLLLFALFTLALFFSCRRAALLTRTGSLLHHWRCSRSSLSRHSVVEDFLLEQIKVEGRNGVQLPVNVKRVGSLRLFRLWLDKSDLLLLLQLLLLLKLLLLLTVTAAVGFGGWGRPAMFNKFRGGFQKAQKLDSRPFTL